jgi:hypothetical protein
VLVVVDAKEVIGASTAFAFFWSSAASAFVNGDTARMKSMNVITKRAMTANGELKEY